MTEHDIYETPDAELLPQLAALVNEERLAHAYIFTGKEALGQALALARAVNCGNREQGQPCGVCPSCKKVSGHSHADCRLFLPERGAHRLEAMRRLQAAAILQSYEGGYKVFIIEGAELLLEEAANNLLKLLEEPPPHTLLILCCANQDRLPPTIRSRCQLLLFGADHNVVLEEAHIESLLPRAEEFLARLPALTLTQTMLESRREELDKEGWLHYLAALMRILSAGLKGERALPMSHPNALKAALLMDNTLDLLRRNINQKLLLDIVYLRLWQYAKSGEQ
ncbi:MAG: hypothetical protein FWF04_05760 [Clostridiales bacterium]|nr:hypothetical protein [Clostridiales bacterium]